MTAQEYWQGRYTSGGNSGPGSYGNPARYKADFLNAFVREHGVHSVIEYGCGDGHQLTLAEYPTYVGLDVSRSAVGLCRDLFEDDATKLFRVCRDPLRIPAYMAELALSLDVVYHLIEDDVYEAYMRALFLNSWRYVIIYADVTGGPTAPHCCWRDFPAWVAEHEPEWVLLHQVPKPVPSAEYQDFYVFGRALNSDASTEEAHDRS